MSDKKFLDGLIVKKPHEKAPDFVICKLSFKVEDVIKSLQENQSNGWVNLDVKESQEGKYYATIDDWRPNSQNQQPQESAEEDPLPF